MTSYTVKSANLGRAALSTPNATVIDAAYFNAGTGQDITNVNFAAITAMVGQTYNNYASLASTFYGAFTAGANAITGGAFGSPGSATNLIWATTHDPTVVNPLLDSSGIFFPVPENSLIDSDYAAYSAASNYYLTVSSATPATNGQVLTDTVPGLVGLLSAIFYPFFLTRPTPNVNEFYLTGIGRQTEIVGTGEYYLNQIVGFKSGGVKDVWAAPAIFVTVDPDGGGPSEPLPSIPTDVGPVTPIPPTTGPVPPDPFYMGGITEPIGGNVWLTEPVVPHLLDHLISYARILRASNSNGVLDRNFSLIHELLTAYLDIDGADVCNVRINCNGYRLRNMKPTTNDDDLVVKNV